MKLLLKNGLKYPFIALFCMLFSISGKASHIAGMDLTYKHISGTTYEITAVYYRDCAGIAAPTSVTVNIKSVSAGVNKNITLSKITGTGQVISTPCSSLQTICTGGTEPGIQKWEYRGTTTLGSFRSDWEFYTGLCCRNNAITTIVSNQGGSTGQGAGTSVTAKLNNLSAQTNSSPYFTNNPFAFICINQNFTFNHGVVDVDGDSLVYSFVQPQSDATGGSTLYPVTYLAPYSFTNPLSSSTPITLDPVTGNINMTPNQIQITVMAVEIKEYRNGNLIGSVIRDMEMWITNCGSNSLPVASGINGTTNYSVVTCPGQQVCFNILTSDANATQNVTLSWNNGIPGASFTQTSGSRPTGNFCWTPTTADQGTNVFTVTVKDDACPNNGLQVFSYNVHVGGGTVTAQANNVTCNGGTNGFINLTVNGGIAPYTYLWSNNDTAATASNLAVGTYTVVVTDASGCTMTTSATVSQPSAISLTASSTNTSCAGSSDGNASITASGGTAPYTYLWTTGDTASSISGLAAGSYTVTVTDNAGCTATASVNITSPASFNAIITTSTGQTTFCIGDSLGLDAGTGYATYLWDNNNTTQSITVNTSGTYSVIVTNSAGCSATASITVQDSVCCRYAISKDTVDCNKNTFCVKLSAVAPVNAGIIGMSYCLTYDPNIMTPTGNYTIGNVVTANLSNPTGAQAQLNTNIIGSVHTAIYYNSTVPAGTSWSGSGDVICIEFQLKPGVSQGTYALSTCALDEEYTIATVTECAKAGSITIDKTVDGKIVYWNYDQVHASPARPVVYDITNPSAYNKTNIFSPLATTNTDMNGAFVWDYTKGTSVTIEKDITGKYGDASSTCEDVFMHVNGADAYLAALISTFDVNNVKDSIPNWIPNAFQMLSSDVNMDDKVRANDITLIMSRSVRSICEYPQVWNYTQGTQQNPTPANGQLSKDWRFFDSERLYDNTNAAYKEFQVDPAYPVITGSAATNGYWRDNVPNVPFILPIADTANNNCPHDMLYYGVMLGDVDGFWNALDTATHSRSTNETVAEMIFDVTNIISLGANRYRIAVSANVPSTSVSFDFRMDYDETKIKNVQVSKTFNSEIKSQWNDVNASSLYLTSYTLKGIKGNTGKLFYIDFETTGTTFDVADLGDITSLINGEKVSTKSMFSGISEEGSFGTVSLYPNPSKGEITYTINVDGIKNVAIDITNVLGQIVYQSNQEVNETLRQNVSLASFGKGVYFLRVIVDGKSNVSKIVVE